MRLADDALRSAFEHARSRFLRDDGYAHDPLAGIEASGRFTDFVE
jgi:hypothetical protein